MSEQHLEHIKFTRIRPRIQFEYPDSPSAFSATVKKSLQQQNKIDGDVLSSFITIYPVEEDQHYWSPQLTLTIEETEHGSLIRGLYGPQPSVWTLFIFFYSVIGFAALMVSMIGLSFVSLGKDASILWLVPVLILLFCSLYLVAYLGQKFGHKQMIYLHHFMEECVGNRIDTK
ncbi:MAG: hypothetical protein ACQETE_09160 [Bacteroidota bacterium]